MTVAVVDWLLGESTPAVAFRTRRDLLGESAGSPRLLALASRRNQYPPVATMLSRADEAMAAGLYKKYQGLGWTLVFLAEMDCDGGDPRAERLARAVLASQLESGGFAPRGTTDWEIVCLTANLLRSLVGLGLADEPGVAHGYARLTERIRSHDGIPCRVIDEHSARRACHMAIPQTLRALAAAPSAAGSQAEAIPSTIALLVRQLRSASVYRYMRRDAGRYRSTVRLRPKGERERGTSVLDFKREYRRRNPVTAEDRVPKASWLRFGFPSSFNPDLVEAMLALAECGVECHPSLEEALDVIESKRRPDGRWTMASSLNGRMLADVEKRGKPSKWVTLRALTVLRHFGRIEV